MKQKHKKALYLSHLLLVVLIITLFIPGKREAASPFSFLGAILLCELIGVVYHQKKKGVSFEILTIIWVILLIWEILVSKANLLHPVLFPAPENVFRVFTTQYPVLFDGIFSSLRLLAGGVFVGLSLGSLAGLICGWNKSLGQICVPIARVLAPIPSIVYAPYLIVLMPTFRSASALVIIAGVFWPSFLNMVLRIENMDSTLLDLARTMALPSREMIIHVLLPYALPGLVLGLKVMLTTSVMLLVFAEMMGATSGMGYYIVNNNTYGNYTNVVAGIIVVGVVVTLLSIMTNWLQKKLIPWQ